MEIAVGFVTIWDGTSIKPPQMLDYQTRNTNALKPREKDLSLKDRQKLQVR